MQLWKGSDVKCERHPLVDSGSWARYKELESFDICENVDHIHLLGITEHLELNRGKGRWKIRKELTP